MVSQVTLDDPSNDWNREPTAEELANAPIMTQDEMTSIMKSEEYKTSKLVQKLVAASIAKADPSAGRFAPTEPQSTGDEIAAKMDTVQQMYRDPRYKSSALYRLEVAQKVANLTANDNQAISAGDLSKTNQTVSIGVSSSPFHGADLQVKKFHRVELSPDPQGSEAPKRPSKPTPSEFANS